MDRSTPELLESTSLGRVNIHASPILEFADNRLTTGRVDSIRNGIKTFLQKNENSAIEIPDEIDNDTYFWMMCMYEYLDLRNITNDLSFKDKFKLKAIKTALDKYTLQSEATVDPLTQLPNRRALEFRIREIQQHTKPLSENSPKIEWRLVFLDIDHFKEFNSKYSHAAGDEVLKNTGLALLEHTKMRGDQIFRYGGEEFVALVSYIPNDNDPSGANIAEMIRTRVSGNIQYNTEVEKIPIQLTAATIPLTDEHPEALYKRASELLTAAKNQGRNRCVDENGNIVTLPTAV